MNCYRIKPAAGAFGASLLLLFGSCNKDTGLSPSEKKLVYGDVAGMLVQTFDTILAGSYQHMKFLDLDINMDGIDDFRLKSEIWGSPAIGQIPKSSVQCLHSNSFLYGDHKNDTTYLNTLTTVVTQPDSSIGVYTAFTYACFALGQNDAVSAIHTNRFRLIPKSKNEMETGEELYSSENFTFLEGSYSLPVIPVTSNDTTYYNSTHYFNNCSTFPSDRICYAGIKLIAGGHEKSGWIKLSVSQLYKIYLLECAIQN